jgi:ABC-type multidrug transport system fused ATPase/permease subunit
MSTAGRVRRAIHLIRSLVRPHRRLFAIAVSGAAVFALCTVASSIAVQWVVDHVIVPRFDRGSVGAATVAAGILLVIGVGIVRAAGVVVRRAWAGKTQWRAGETLTDDVVDRLVTQPVSWHDRHTDGDLVARAGIDADTSVAVLAPVPFASSTFLLIFVAGIWMLLTDTVLGAVAVAVFPALVGVNVVYQRRVDPFFTEAQDHLGHLTSAVNESFAGVTVVKAYGAERRETERLAVIASRLRQSRVHALRLRASFEATLEALPSLTNAGLVLIGAMRVDSGDLTVGQLSSFIYMFTLLVLPLRLIGYALSELPHSMAGYQRIRSLLDEAIEPDPATAIGVASPPDALAAIGVSFGYEGDQRHALRNIDFAVPAGSVLAIVGPTGAGKSTLVSVLAGLLPPSTGEVRAVGGRPPAIVFQEAFLFAGTIRDNLTIGRLSTDDELWRSLRSAAAEGFVAELPAGLDTVVGERGVSLSGGQRQRIALARALLRSPDVVLLDDTTSALDPSTEALVLENLRSSLASTTVVVVASRPSTIALADRVLFLEDGTVAGIGTHAELLASEPGYRALVEAFETDRRDRAGEPATVAAGPQDVAR